MAGALTERDFVAKLERAGFTSIEILDRREMGIDELAGYPLFPDDLLRAMRTLIPSARHGSVATAVISRARLSPTEAHGPAGS